MYEINHGSLYRKELSCTFWTPANRSLNSVISPSLSCNSFFRYATMSALSSSSCSYFFWYSSLLISSSKHRVFILKITCLLVACPAFCKDLPNFNSPSLSLSYTHMNLTHGQYINGLSVTYVYNTLHTIHKF